MIRDGYHGEGTCHACVRVCVYIMCILRVFISLIRRGLTLTGYGCQSSLWSTEQGRKCFPPVFPFPFESYLVSRDSFARNVRLPRPVPAWNDIRHNKYYVMLVVLLSLVSLVSLSIHSLVKHIWYHLSICFTPVASPDDSGRCAPCNGVPSRRSFFIVGGRLLS